MNNITTTIEEITPSIASLWLQGNTKNRPLNRDLVTRYANAITRGEWVFNGDTYRFSNTGKVLDGQHRLCAIIESGVCVTGLIVRGLLDEVFPTIDSGKKRTISDVLSMKNYKHTCNLGAVLSLIYYDKTTGIEMINSKLRPTTQQLLDIVEENPSIYDSVRLFTSLSDKRKLVSCSISAFIHYSLCHRGYKERATEFFMGLYNGSDLPSGSPVLVLRNLFIEKRALGGVKFNQKHTIAVMIKAWNKYIQNQKITKIIHSDNESMPRLYTPSFDERAQVEQ